MNGMSLSNLSFPIPTRSFFDKVISLDWYDGTTSGVVTCSQFMSAFRFDILAWGPYQDTRIFAISPLAVEDFEQIVRLYGDIEVPVWPYWYPKWPTGSPGEELLRTGIDGHLANAKGPEFVVASDSMFETLLAAKRLDASSREQLPGEFDGIPFRDNFDYWKEFLRLGQVPQPKFLKQ